MTAIWVVTLVNSMSIGLFALTWLRDEWRKWQKWKWRR